MGKGEIFTIFQGSGPDPSPPPPPSPDPPAGNWPCCTQLVLLCKTYRCPSFHIVRTSAGPVSLSLLRPCLLERRQSCLITPAERLMKVNQLGYWRSTQDKHTRWWPWAILLHHKCGEVRGRKMYFSTSMSQLSRLNALGALWYTLSMWLLRVRVPLKITPRYMWPLTCGTGMPAIGTEFCGATHFDLLPPIIICSLFFFGWWTCWRGL